MQQAVNVLIPLINNTPIRDVLNLFEPQSESRVGVVRLFGEPVSTVLSPDGTRAYVTTIPYQRRPYPLDSPPAPYITVNVIDTSNNTIVGVPVVIQGEPAADLVLSPDGQHAYQTTYLSDIYGLIYMTLVTGVDTRNSTAGSPIALSGSAWGGLVLTPDGSKGYQVMSGFPTWTVTTIDTVHNNVVGEFVVVSRDIVFSADRSHLFADSDLSITSGPDGSTIINFLESTTFSTINVDDGTTIGTPITMEGSSGGAPVLSPDGMYAVQSTHLGVISTAVAVIDTTTNTLVAEPAVIDGVKYGEPYPVFSQSGSRVVQLTGVYDSSTESRRNYLTVIDTATGAIVGDPVLLAGEDPYYDTLLVAPTAGNQVYVSSTYGALGRDFADVQVVDTTTGTIVGSPVQVDGWRGSMVAAPDGSRVYLTTRTSDLSTTVFTTVGSDGTQIGDSIAVAGSPVNPLVLSPDGSRAYQTILDGTSIRVVVIDTETGSTLGNPITVEGNYYPPPRVPILLSPDGRRMYVTTTVDNPVFGFNPLSFLTIFGIIWPVGPYLTHVTVLDTSAI